VSDFWANLGKAVEVALPKEPVHVYDIGMEARWIRELRLWAKDKQRGPRIYPVHGYATISGTPFTMFRCRNGHTHIGEPYCLPDRPCFHCDIECLRSNAVADDPQWQPIEHGDALSYIRSLGESEEMIRRTQERMTPPPDRSRRGSMSSLDGFKLDVPHSEDCLAVTAPRPFVLHDGVEWRRDKRGRRGGSRMWHRFRCNDPKCPSIVLVRWDVLADVVDASLAQTNSEEGARR
jgi:hypothetical protein